VFGVFPTTEDPKSAVIWEAFQPQTEKQRSFRSAIGDPYNSAQRQQALQAWQQQQLQLQQQQQEQHQQRAPSAVAQPQPQSPPPATGLPTQNTF
jgi:penicillin-binding protein 1A